MTEILTVEDLEVHFRQRGWRKQPLHAVDGVSFGVNAGETVGLVGESGSGKSTIGRAILGLTPVARGSVRFGDTPLSRTARAAALQAVFQDPYSTLDPLRTIGQTLAEPLIAQRIPRDVREERTTSMLARVGLPEDAGSRYPHEFSGGQRQRIAIARALVLDPQLVVCDEPISALDLSTQAAVLNLLRELQREGGVAYLFVAHDLAAVHHVSHRVIVLYRGRIMESGTTEQICERPLHPYSQALWAASPVPHPARQRARRAARHQTASASASTPPPKAGCPFAPRCPHAEEICRTRRPIKSTVDGRGLECHLFDPATQMSGATVEH